MLVDGLPSLLMRVMCVCVCAACAVPFTRCAVPSQRCMVADRQCSGEWHTLTPVQQQQVSRSCATEHLPVRSERSEVCRHHADALLYHYRPSTCCLCGEKLAEKGRACPAWLRNERALNCSASATLHERCYKAANQARRAEQAPPQDAPQDEHAQLNNKPSEFTPDVS